MECLQPGSTAAHAGRDPALREPSKELASQQATAPLQQQIADLNKLISDQQAQIAKLQQQMQADSTAATQARDAAHSAGLRDGAGWRGR